MSRCWRELIDCHTELVHSTTDSSVGDGNGGGGAENSGDGSGEDISGSGGGDGSDGGAGSAGVNGDGSGGGGDEFGGERSAWLLVLSTKGRFIFQVGLKGPKNHGIKGEFAKIYILYRRRVGQDLDKHLMCEEG